MKTSWYANTKGIQGIVYREGDGKSIAISYDPADAPLIAAAPELLEALEMASKFAYDRISGFGVREGNKAAKVYNAARAAIEKAKS